MSVKKGRKLRDLLLILGTVVMLLGSLHEAFFTVGAVIAFSSLLPHFLFNKCLHCGKQLGRNEGEFCQFCGKPLE